MMVVRGIRGAISVTKNSPEEIKGATKELINEILGKNQILPDDIASAFFSVTKGIDAEFPAKAAREIGWVTVPMMCTTEMDVPGSIQGIIRLMLHVNTDKTQQEIVHVYLKEAQNLRPDLVG